MNVLGVDLPSSAVTLDGGYFVAIANFSACSACSGQELLGQSTEVNVSTDVGPGDSDLAVCRTATAHQWQVLVEDLPVIGKLHAWEKVVVFEHVIATLQVIHLDFALCEGHVWDWVNEFAWVYQDAVVDLVGPELACHLELLIDGHCLGDINLAALFRRVVQLAQCGVAGTSIIPRGR